MSRAAEREAATVSLYQSETTGRPLEETLGRAARPFATALARAVAAHQGELDALIARHARGWSVARIRPLERAILRVALLEILHPGSLPGDAPIPPEGAIEEAVRAARKFCSAEAPGFVNGVLDAALREVRENVPVGESASGP